MLRVFVIFVIYILCSSHQAAASDVEWELALSSSNPGISQPQLPASFSLKSRNLADAGDGLLGFQLSPYGTMIPDGNWFEHGSTFTQYAALDVAGSLGPGRSGAENSHVFRQLYPGDSIGTGERAFGAMASAPGAPSSDITQGIWLSDGTRNVEIVRSGSDGALGPGLGNGLYYRRLSNVDSPDEFDVRMLPGGRVLFAGNVGSASSIGGDGLSVHDPGSGNKPCMLRGTGDSEFGPGIAAEFHNMGAHVSVSPRGEIFDYATVRASPASPPGFHGAEGFWQFCDGSPRLAVLTGDIGEFGPGLSDHGARFGGDLNGLKTLSAPGQPGSFYFTSGGRMSDNSTFLGLFLHDKALARNVPVVLEDDAGSHGPQIPGYVFSAITSPYRVRAAGKYGVLLASIAAAGTNSPKTYGLWRLVSGGVAEPIAIAGDTGAYAPAPGRVWTDTFVKYAVFDSGDIVTLARTRRVSDGSTAMSWWRLRRSEAPVEILKVGDLVQVTTPGGVVSKAVTAIGHESAAPQSQGQDTWYSANGSIIADHVTIEGFEEVTQLVRGIAAQTDLVFANGFD